MRQLILIAHNLRSAHNVGSLLRTAEGLGVAQLFLTGYTPYPSHPGDSRLPHITATLDKQIAKTSLGAEAMIPWSHKADLSILLASLTQHGYLVAGVEQAPHATPLPDFKPPEKLALIVGREVEGLEPEILAACDQVLEIPMLGRKESFNVAQAAAMALYHCRFYP
jgi:tRNA G18 (ribose-2'-O)-methylase SpoU